ncbi:DUF4190 domain-containing protein [Aureibaculum marinum]|uniref:DUF4190 domain-containing protein n=1 Tax=Aureibaculum marinum TaxID=2487930 RepID=A0A3N4NJA4_9FLAO|nr:CCC motif membrane protein [Aureibaculum marinum]RPD94477.1 DUF4190 domain-containing protein [Aureibaculum marinum]
MEKQKLPNSKTSLILGVISIVSTFCCCFIPGPGIILGLIGMNSAKKAKALDQENPDMYEGINNANTGALLSKIGLIIGILTLAWFIYRLATVDFDLIIEQYKEVMEQMQQGQ